MMLEEISDVDAATPVYHWVIDRCHKHFKAILGDELYKKVIVVTPRNNENDFKWIVNRDSEIIVSITDLMVCVMFSYFLYVQLVSGLYCNMSFDFITGRDTVLHNAQRDLPSRCQRSRYL